MKPPLTLDSGRVVKIVDFHLLFNIPHLLTGDPRSPRMWDRVVNEQAPVRAVNLLGQTLPVVTLPPEPGPPPLYTVIVKLESPEPVSEGDWSSLGVVWFLNSAEGTLAEIVRNAVHGIDWDRHARDATID